MTYDADTRIAADPLSKSEQFWGQLGHLGGMRAPRGAHICVGSEWTARSGCRLQQA